MSTIPCALFLSASPQFHLTTLLYADPGSGILIWQLATAGVLGLMFYAKTILRRIRELTRSRQSQEGQEPPASNQ